MQINKILQLVVEMALAFNKTHILGLQQIPTETQYTDQRLEFAKMRLENPHAGGTNPSAQINNGVRGCKVGTKINGRCKT